VTSRIESFLDHVGQSKTDLAKALGLDPSTVSRKISGDRPWKQMEIQGLIAFLSERLSRPVTYEELFGTTPTTPDDESVLAPERAS